MKLVDEALQRAGAGCARALVVAAGGSADILLAKGLAELLVEAGCRQVDLAQPLKCQVLAQYKRITGSLDDWGLDSVPGLEPNAVLRHARPRRATKSDAGERGKGLSISTSVSWGYGDRFIVAALGAGPHILAARCDADAPYYDLALAIDGGGDVLTHDEAEFDRIVVDGLQSGWHGNGPLMLAVMGLGADGGSSPEQFESAGLAGWSLIMQSQIDLDFADLLERELMAQGLWLVDPAGWTARDQDWGYGLKVPQIMAMARRGQFPFGDAPGSEGHVLFPRRRSLHRMDKELLVEARLYLCQETK